MCSPSSTPQLCIFYSCFFLHFDLFNHSFIRHFSHSAHQPILMTLSPKCISGLPSYPSPISPSQASDVFLLHVSSPQPSLYLSQGITTGLSPSIPLVFQYLKTYQGHLPPRFCIAVFSAWNVLSHTIVLSLNVIYSVSL